MRSPGVRRTLAVLALGVATVTGCGSASPPSPPAGVDGLVVPTPSPDPADFGAGIDNPWFPVPGDAQWTYQVTDVDGAHRRQVAAHDGREIAGIETTGLRTVEEGSTVTDYFAQDDAGNVWWFGREGVWQAGVDGAEAGVVMLARPRVGDGYRQARLAGTVDDRAQVLSVTDTVEGPMGEYDDVVLTRVTSPLRPGVTIERAYAPGVGLVEERVVGDEGSTVRLVATRLP